MPQSPRRKIITFEFGKHIDLCFVNLEGHGSPNLFKMKRDKKLNFRCNFGQLLFNFKLMTLTFLSEII